VVADLGALILLGVNVVSLIVAGFVTLVVQRYLVRRSQR
jgi:hypothetical protein